MDVKRLIPLLSQQLKSAGNPQKQKDLTKYMKGVLPCYGLSTPQNRALFKDFYKAHLSSYSQDDIRTLGFELLKVNALDEKVQGIECLVKTIKTFTPEHLHTLERFPVASASLLAIIDACVFDWATSDNLSCHVVTKAMINNPECIKVVNSWKDAPSWRQRSACVSMLHFARRDLHTEVILDICESAVRNKYRFTQLGVGWVLRDVSVHHPQLIIDFLNKHEDDFIREAVRYATEKMAPSQKKLVHALSTNHFTSRIALSSSCRLSATQ
ncbi:hypothetical protein BLSTO_03480 [Blastocystis sp. subtype 1]